MAGETLEFKLCGVDNSFANGLRRVMQAEVPTLGIESVTIIQNTSTLPDEMIAHRIGLVPLLSMKARHMNYERDCSCSGVGCPSCRITGELHAECPIDQSTLQVFANESMHIDDPDVRPVSVEEKGVWLVTLGRAQKLILRFVIRKNIAKTHAKFMPVATVAMRYAPEITTNPEGLQRLTPDQCREWVARCPRGVFHYDARDHRVTVRNPDECIFCRECYSEERPFDKLPEPLVSVRQKKDARGYFDFTFVVESTGVLPVVQIVYDAIEVLSKKLLKIRTGLLEGAGTEETIQTRTIGGAPTAPVVLNEDAIEREGAEDNLNLIL